MVSCSQAGRSRRARVTGVRFFTVGGWAGCAGGWVVLGVGAGIGFGFGGATCRGGVVGLEVPGLFVLAAFWSFANRFSRIYPRLLNIVTKFVGDLFTLSASSWGVAPSWCGFGFGSELMVVVEIIGVRPRGDPRAPPRQTRRVALVTPSRSRSVPQCSSPPPRRPSC